ncbi:MAG: 4-hydroxy-tetrahydrodipicolinate synthase [Prevotellaceae bacterium]|jgi:4-hydroxy-tetrahydrodipicolinate synthase|nr:4-hydroxy-tetrahydrodipicolinate synthase [Prevotellaceae bacterium]
MNNFSGLGVALVTPFKTDKSIDFDALSKTVEYVSDNGVDFLVVLGTTAETPVLNAREKQDVIKTVIENNTKKLPIIIGAGGNNTQEVINAVADVCDEADAVLSVVPYYNKPSQRGIAAHFSAVADASKKPVVLYNVPGRTGVNMTADTCLKLAEHKNIVAIKEASGNLNQLSYILRDKPEDFIVLSGDDGLTLPQMAMGIDGVISVVANAFPYEFGKMVHLAQKGNFAEASHVHLKLIEIIDLLFIEGNPAGIKAAMEIKGLIKNELRLPLVKSSEILYEKLKEAYKKL